MARGTHTMSLIPLRTAGGQPSGPGDLSTVSDFNLPNTDCGGISISEITRKRHPINIPELKFFVHSFTRPFWGVGRRETT